MPILLYVRDMGQVMIPGGLEEAEAIIERKRDHITAKATKNGHEVCIRTEQVVAAEVIPDAEYEQQQKAAAEKAEAEAKANPRPGAAPKLMVPGGKIVKLR